MLAEKLQIGTIEDNDDHWQKVKDNVLNLHEKSSDQFDVLKTILGLKFKAVDLNKIMKKVRVMADSAVHFGAFRCAVQANLLQDQNCDKPLHKLLKDALEFLSAAKFTDDDEDEAMDVEEGEVMTDTGAETDASILSTASKKSGKKQILTLPTYSKLSLEDIKSGNFDLETSDFDLWSIRKHEIFADDDFVWINSKQRIDLRQKVQNYDVENVLRYIELYGENGDYSNYSKELLKLYPDVKVIEKGDAEKIDAMLKNGEVKVTMQSLSVDKMLQEYLKIYTKLSSNR